MWRQSSAEPVVVIVSDLDGEEINDFATRLFTHWGIGKKDKDNGVLMLISTGEACTSYCSGTCDNRSRE